MLDESIKEALKEVKLIKSKKIKTKNWRDILKEIKKDKE